MLGRRLPLAARVSPCERRDAIQSGSFSLIATVYECAEKPPWVIDEKAAAFVSLDAGSTKKISWVKPHPRRHTEQFLL